MAGFSKEMQDALKADAAKLSAMTGEEHTVEFFDFSPCPLCGETERCEACSEINDVASAVKS